MDDDERLARTLEPQLTLRCKVVLLGDSTVGKTALAQVLQHGVQGFPKNYNPTFGVELAVKNCKIPETNATVEMYVVDCGGASITEDMARPHWENANAFVFVYDVTNTESFTNLKEWYEKISSTRMDTAITGVVLANKIDLIDRPNTVSPELGKEFAKKHLLEFFETSTIKAEVEAPFHLLALAFHTKYEDHKPGELKG
mmetsp:Transcript_31832/g.69662  ORF Transcript_31832/g.69662 Transcript_31832/m.69662 type:complete len:199 (+) Transcript_31832:42-638(+)